MNTDFVGTICFALAILHTFSVKQFQEISHRFPERSVLANVFHLLGEVEVVFGLWAGAFMTWLAFSEGSGNAIRYVEGLSFVEPAFVFVVMVVSSTRPVLGFAFRLISAVSRLLPLRRTVALYAVTLTLGPLLGSFITEPAAMTVTASILLERFYSRRMSPGLMYATIGLLFVNISIGGTLTHFAAPPVLMVAGVWDWDTPFMMRNFGWKGALAAIVSTVIVTAWHYRELAGLPRPEKRPASDRLPPLVVALHLLFLGLIVASSHYIPVFMWLFLFFLGLVTVTSDYQSELRLREGLLVAFFLAGLVVLGPPQRWWLQPLLGQLDADSLYFGAMALTSITDNAALTYLGSLTDLGLTERYALVAGAVVGGGLTVIANAPNPAGFGILNRAFGEDGISPLRLFAGALIPTAVAAAFFWLL